MCFNLMCFELSVSVHVEKIRVRKEEVGYKDHVKPLSAIEAFCERFDKAVKNSSTTVSTTRHVTASLVELTS